MEKELVFGGIIGVATNSQINNCKNYGNITAEGGYIGGISDEINQTSMENCANYGEITCTGIKWANGGIVSIADGGSIIRNCANLNNVSGGSKTAGIVSNTYKYGEGIVLVENTYNSGKIEGKVETIGLCACEQKSMTIKNSYNVGTVVLNANKPSNLNATYKKFYNSDYPNVECNAQNIYYLDKSCSVGKGEKKTEAEMKDANFLKNFDPSIWTSDVKDGNGNWIYNNGYPIFAWQKQ